MKYNITKTELKAIEKISEIQCEGNCEACKAVLNGWCSFLIVKKFLKNINNKQNIGELK